MEALHQLCEEGTISAWFEAVEDEDMREKLAELDNVYLTPHYGWWTEEAQQRLRDTVIENIESYLKGQPQNVVN